MDADIRWLHSGVTQEDLEQKAAWIGRDAPWRGTQIMYFRTAANLLRFAWFDYTLLPAIFFHAVAGLEGVLRGHPRSEEENFRSLFSKAVEEGWIGEATFTNPEPLPKHWLRRFGLRGLTYPQQLAILIPALRNDYFHGAYLLCPSFLGLAVQMREAADAIPTRRNGAQPL